MAITMLQVGMIAAFIAVMLAIKFFVAPAIVASYGVVGVIAWIGACLAIGRWLEG